MHSPTPHTPPPAPQAKLTAKAPFNQYASLPGLKVKWGSPTDYTTFPEGPFDVVYDNNGKDLESCKPLIDASKVGACDVCMEERRRVRKEGVVCGRAVVQLFVCLCASV